MSTPEVPTPSLAWTRQIGSSEYDHAEDMAIDAFGNIYLAGHSRGQMGSSSSDKEDSWIAKFNAQGNLLWKEQFGSDKNDFVQGIATDQFGFLYACGQTTGSKVDAQHQGGTDAWLAKYDPDGRRIWIRQIGTDSEDAGHGIAVNLRGEIYVAGYTTGDLGTRGEENPDTDAWIARYDNHGNQIWLKHVGSQAIDIAYDIAVDDFGHVYMGGYTRGRISTNSADRGSKQIWVMQLDDEGEQLWLREFGAGGKDDEVRSIATDNQGNLFVTGMTYLERTVDGVELLKRNVFVTKIRSNGVIHWNRFLGSEETDVAYGIATDPMGNVFVTGFTKGEMEEGKAGGNSDAFVAKYNTAGEQLWVSQIATGGEEKGEAVAVDSFGNIYVAGLTEGRLDQGQTYGTGADAWLSKYFGSVTEDEKFHLLSDYLQQINNRMARIEVRQTNTYHNRI